MASFVALNIEPEDDSEDEIDDSKEIQIEEALKLYQVALKLHSQGPNFYDEAEQAYKNLFASEIFTYPESRRNGDFDNDEIFYDSIEESPFAGTAVATTGSEGAPSTLPQVLYLSYKNHGQFLLDRLKYDILQIRLNKPLEATESSTDFEEISSTASSSLGLFTEALIRDNTDLELWRLVSRVGEFLGSKRIARFCLEAVLDTSRNVFDSWIENLSLDQIFAARQLKTLLEGLQDHVSERSLPATPEKQISLVKSLKKHWDLCSYLPSAPPEDEAAEQRKESPHTSGQEIRVPLRTWDTCGRSILTQIGRQARGLTDAPAGARYRLVLPPDQSSNLDEIRTKSKKKGKTPLGRISTENCPQPGIQIETTAKFDNSPAAYTKQSNSVSTNKTNPPLPDQSIDHNQGPVDDMEEKSPEQVQTNANGPDTHLSENFKDGGHQPSPIEAIKTAATVSLPTRKRSLDSAGMQENVDSGRSKSKRIKARVLNEPSTGKDSLVEDRAQYYEDKLQIYVQADQSLFESLGILLEKLGTDSIGSLASLRETFSMTYTKDTPVNASLSKNPADIVAQDFRDIRFAWDMEKSVLFVSDDGLDRSVGANGPRNSGLTVFLEHSKRGSQVTSQRPQFSDDHGLQEFAEQLTEEWTYLDQLSLKWVEALLSPRLEQIKGTCIPSMYEAYLWTGPLKDTVVQMLVKQDEYIYLALADRIKTLDPEWPRDTNRSHFSGENLTHTLQTIFELHLDIYGRITNPSSEVDMETRTLQLDRLSRWAALASDAISKRPDLDINTNVTDELGIRFLWSTVLYTSLVDPASRDHIVLCLRDLKIVLEDSCCPTIELQNNAIMPEISIEAAEREISRLTTRDFFLTLFNSEQTHPLMVIESLEPILQKSIRDIGKSKDDPMCKDVPPSETLDPSDPQNLHMQHMLQFLDRASTSLKVFLWRKLGDAYEAIDYPPQMLSCTLRSIEIVIKYLQSIPFITSTTQSRQLSLVRWLRSLDKLTKKALTLVMSRVEAKIRPGIFDCVDDAHARSSIAALASLQRILYVFMFCEDSIRIGQTTNPMPPNGPANTAHSLVSATLHDMLINVWILQYTLLKDALTPMTPNRDLSTTPPSGDLLDYLNYAHHALGLRGYCKCADRLFLRFLKKELFLKKDPCGNTVKAIAQVIFDLHGLKVGPNPADLQDHASIHNALDRETAVDILDLVMAQVNQINMKDLGKSELRSTIEKMQTAIKVPKPIVATAFNRKLVNNFLKSSINPMDLYRSLQGMGGLSGVSVRNENSSIADKGWYFLHGHLALVKFRSVRRSSPGPIEDLDNATTFFKQDLELGVEKWETWFRLAQVFDARIEEDITWTAEKLNNNREELRVLQRSAIHCYTMATVMATRSAEPSFVNASKISDLYTDFATRIYASSREPFSMEAFTFQKLKYFNGQKRGMYEDSPFREMQLYPAWKFASTLLRRASVHKSHSWMNFYMLGKCLWKMHNCSDQVRGRARKISYVDALEAFRRAVELLPERRDSRHPEKQLTLEPHYKLVSTVHKLVQSRRIRPEAGCDYLNATSYAQGIPAVRDLEEWEEYILHVLKALRFADKANWHHRIVARAAHAIYDDSPYDVVAALGAKHELTQQIFTKTMQIQVWKPDNERPGRHFVYTGRYVSFFIEILFRLDDRSSLEALAKRYRKRSGDFFNHTKIWEEVCWTYLKLLRRLGSIPTEQEDFVFRNVPPNVVRRKADQLEAWAHQSPPPSSAILDVLREAIELKKLNGNLMKPTPIEDLIGDAYALLYSNVEPEQTNRPNGEENRSKLRVDHLIRNNPNNSQENSNDNSEAPTPVLLPEDMDAGAGLIPITEITTARSRYRNVSRKEIQRNAETLVAIKPPLPVVPGIATKPPSSKGLAPAAIPEPNDPQLLSVREDGRDVAREGSSIPGSLHDSADDESELSDVGAEEGRPIMFPGLVNAGSRGEGDADEGRSEIEDSQGDEDDEGDELG